MALKVIALTLLGVSAIIAQQLSGLVVDDRSGLPVAGATIRLHLEQFGQMPSWISAITDERGRFSAAAKGLGRYSVECSARGYLDETSRHDRPMLDVRNDGAVVPASVTIRLIPEARIAGTVMTEAGQPVDGASVKWAAARGATGLNADGRFEVGGLPECLRNCELIVLLSPWTRKKYKRQDTRAGEVVG